jgi:hypothetical protein
MAEISKSFLQLHSFRVGERVELVYCPGTCRYGDGTLIQAAAGMRTLDRAITIHMPVVAQEVFTEATIGGRDY